LALHHQGMIHGINHIWFESVFFFLTEMTKHYCKLALIKAQDMHMYM